MKLFKEVIKKLNLMIFYTVPGITFTFLELYATKYFQVISDSFTEKKLRLSRNIG